MKIMEGELPGEILSSFIKQFYAGTPYIPSELMLPQEIEDMEVLEEWLSQKRGHKVQIKVPKKAQKRSWWSWLQGMRSLFSRQTGRG